MCLLSVYILGCADGIVSFKFGTGELLCALAGAFYGINIAVTGIKAKNLDTGLYLFVQFGVHAIISTIFAFIYEKPIFSFKPLPLLMLVSITLISTVFGWIIRTICLKHLDPTLVTVIMPFSSVITTMLSIIAGMDKISRSLIIGATIGVIAVIVCDIKKKEKITEPKSGETE